MPMNRSIVTLAAFVISSQVFAGGTPIVHTPQQPVQQGPTGVAPPIPQLTSAKFVKSEYYPGEVVDVKFDGINLQPNTGLKSYSICFASAQWPSEFHWNPNFIFPVAQNGAWGLLSSTYGFTGNVTAPNFPGTYSVSFYPGTWGDFSGTAHPCAKSGPITASFVVKPGLLVPKTPPSVSQ